MQMDSLVSRGMGTEKGQTSRSKGRRMETRGEEQTGMHDGTEGRGKVVEEVAKAGKALQRWKLPALLFLVHC